MPSPIANQTAAIRVARRGSAPSISAANSAAATVIEIAVSRRGPISAPRPGASSE